MEFMDWRANQIVFNNVEIKVESFLSSVVRKASFTSSVVCLTLNVEDDKDWRN